MGGDGEAVMLDLNDFRYFVRIVEGGSLTAASRNLKVPKSTVSHRLQQLEASLGVRLLNRMSRSLIVTDAGETFSATFRPSPGHGEGRPRVARDGATALRRGCVAGRTTECAHGRRPCGHDERSGSK
jgi:DNA-binding transcriptional LysR family regulator